MTGKPRRRHQSVGAALSHATEVLSRAGVDSPAVDASALVEAVTGLSRTDQLLRRDAALEAHQAEELERLLARRAAREPLQHVLGEVTFLDVRLEARPGVLVPRPETERLVELVLSEIRDAPIRRGDTIIDVGTGTGAIALALKQARPELAVWATDVSQAALDLAGVNAQRLGLALELRRSDLLRDPEVMAAATRAVAIVSNPPYLPDADRDVVQPEVAVEPEAALYAGPDGLNVARRLAGLAREAMRPGALLALELDPRNVSVLAREFEALGFAAVRVEPDLAGRDRFVIAYR
ncbi:MAG TPA: peptide chain release factor N(5)-glutamine methyltransferase [Trueperaceae bacterium]